MTRIPGVASCLLAVAVAVSGCSSPPATAASEEAPRDPRLIEVAAEATASLVLADAPADLALRVRVSAGRLPGAARPPLNLVLVLDTSGSMTGDAIVGARDAARALVRRLGPGDRVAVVAFHSRAEVIVPSLTVTPLARVWADLRLGQLEARGTTDLFGGLRLGLEQVALGRIDGGIDRIVLVGDGVPNDAGDLPGIIEQARAARVAITTLGLGVDFDEVLLGKLALDTGGTHHFAEDATTVAAVFDDELVRMQQVVARNVVVTLTPGPGVTLEAVPGVQRTGTDYVAWLGDLGAGEIRDVIVPLRALGRGAGVTLELVDVAVRYDDVVGGSGVQTRGAFVATTATADAAAAAASVKLPVQVARHRAAAASAILTAILQARSGDVAGGLATLVAAERDTRAAALALADPELLAMADRMASLQASLAQLSVGPASAEAGAGAIAPRAAPAAEIQLRSAQQQAQRALRNH